MPALSQVLFLQWCLVGSVAPSYPTGWDTSHRGLISWLYKHPAQHPAQSWSLVEVWTSTRFTYTYMDRSSSLPFSILKGRRNSPEFSHLPLLLSTHIYSSSLLSLIVFGNFPPILTNTDPSLFSYTWSMSSNYMFLDLIKYLQKPLFKHFRFMAFLSSEMMLYRVRTKSYSSPLKNPVQGWAAQWGKPLV